MMSPLIRSRSNLRRRVMPWVTGLLCVTCVVLFMTHRVEPPRPAPDTSVVWAFTPTWPGAIISSPVVSGDRLYVSAIRDAGLVSQGLVLCLERETGRVLWQFDDGGAMQHTCSSPCIENGRLYVGEGMHANPTCKLYCLNADTGRKLWDFTAAGHLESTPCIADGLVYFSAGDDGVYCRDAATGAARWHYTASIHVDSNLVVAKGMVYAGSGLSRSYGVTEIFCLDAENGKLIWRLPTDLPAWGSPQVDGDELFLGLGNGRMDRSVEPPEKPAGALLCLRADGPKVIWRIDVADAVLAKPAVAAQHVYFVARDGYCYAVDHGNGQLEWKTNLGNPMVANPILAGDNLYVASTNGRVCCLRADDGQERWTFDVARSAKVSAKLFAAPAVVAEGSPGSHVIYVGVELSSAVASAPALYCLRDDALPH